LAGYGPTRNPAALGAHKATKLGDKRKRENRREVPVCTEQERKAEQDRNKWARDLSNKATATMGAWARRMKRAREE